MTARAVHPLLPIPMLLALALLAAPLTGQAGQTDPGAEGKALEGYWTIESVKSDGRPINALIQGKMVFTGTEHSIRARGATEDSWPKGSQVLDPAATPKHIDIHPKTGPHIGKTHLGIYELEGDHCRICLADPPSDARPTAFQSEPGSRLVLISLKRFKAPARSHPAEEAGIRSTDGNVEAKITFTNNSKQPVKLQWIDYNGERKEFATIDPGSSHEQATFLTHPWLVTDENDVPWSIYFADAQPRTVEIVAPEK